MGGPATETVDVVERAEAATRNLVYLSDGTSASNRLGEALDCIPALISEVESMLDELTKYRRDHYHSHMFGHAQDVSNIRCWGCNLRYGERQQYACGDDGQPGAPGGPHHYDEAELAAAGTCDDPIHQYASQFEGGQ